MWTRKKMNNFNPDELVLTKSQILKWLGDCVEDSDGMKYKGLIAFMQITLKTQSEEDLKKLFRRFFLATDKILLANAQSSMIKNSEYRDTLQKMFDIKKDEK